MYESPMRRKRPTCSGGTKGSPVSVSTPLPRAARERAAAAAERLRAELAGGDPHAARLAFARAIQVGGGPIEANLLGIASYKAGDKTGALEAFARAAAGGLDGARQNLANTLRALGLGAAAKEALKRFKGGREGGRRFSPGGS